MNPRSIQLLERNARYMTGPQMGRLTGNLKRDGVLTSVPLVYRFDGDEAVTVISGNHRVQAAVKARLLEIDVMEIVTRITEEELVSIQLSHNSITGQDDPTLLLNLYESLPLPEKLYSGLTDDDFNIEPLDLSSLSVQAPIYEEINLLFLPKDADGLRIVVEELLKRKSQKPAIAGLYQDFEQFFEAIVATKDKLKITNTAIALRMMADLAMQQLQQMDDANDGQ